MLLTQRHLTGVTTAVPPPHLKQAAEIKKAQGETEVNMCV